MHADARQLEEARGGRSNETGELTVEVGAVGVDVQHASCEGVHGELGGVGDAVTVGVRAERRGVTGKAGDGDCAEPFPQLVGGGEAEMAELVETLDPCVASGAVGDQQHTDRFDVAIGGLRHRPGVTTECRPCSFDGVDGVGLAVSPAGLSARAVNLDHRHADSAQETGQAGPVSAGALDPNPLQRAEAT